MKRWHWGLILLAVAAFIAWRWYQKKGGASSAAPTVAKGGGATRAA